MNLKGLIANAVGIAFDLTTDAQADAVLVADSGGASYDSATNTFIGGKTNYALRGIFYHSTQQQMSEDASDIASFLVQVADMLAVGLAVIREVDTLIVAGITWQITSVERDPVDATYTLRLRK